MKVFVALFALVAVAAAAPSVPEHQLQALFASKFRAFKAAHGKEYAAHEEPKRLQNFLMATQIIESHNERYAKGLESYFMGHNDMSDLTMEEYVNTRLGAKRPAAEEHGPNVTLFKAPEGWTRPVSIDWRTWGYVNKVKSQKSCGSCYAFSSNGALEAHYYRKYKRMLDISEQQLVDCTASYGNGGCDGGWMHNNYKYIKENGGINTQENYPYEGVVGKCRYRSDDNQVKLTNYVMIREHDENDLADAVGSVGPVAVAYDAATREFQFYQGGIYYSDSCNAYRTTHAVVVVGYGVENGVDFWIVKNSWGENWGENGYFRMRRNINNKCGISTTSSYPVVM